MQCPNKNHPEFKALVEKYGENLAYYKWAIGEEAPLSVSPPTKIKVVSNAYYDALDNAVDATKNLDTDGNYTTPDKVVHQSVGNFIKTIQTRPFTSEETPGTRAAARLWRYSKDDELKKTTEAAVPISKEQYASLIDVSYERGRAKGEILHLKIHGFVSKDQSVKVKISQLLDSTGINDYEIEWMTDDKIKAIIQKTGTDALSSGGTDRLHTEMTVGDDDLDLYGTIDMLVDHGDSLYSLFDLKTGLRFNRNFEDSFLKYGHTAGYNIFDNARNRAKLQLMLYALIIKAKNPKARFKQLDVLHIKNADSIADEDPLKEVNVPAFLEIIRKTLKYDHPLIYAKLEAKPHFDTLFKPSTYTKRVSGDFTNGHPKANPTDLIKSKMLELQGLILLSNSNLDLGVATTEDSQKIRDKISKLMQEIIELKKDDSVHMSVSDTNMGWMDRYFGSQSYSTNPYVQLYYKELSSAKQTARNNYESWKVKYDNILKKLINSKGLMPVSRLIGGVNREKLFEFAYTEDEKVGTRLITDDDKVLWAKLSDVEREFLTFANESIASVFNKDSMHIIDPGSDKPLADRIVTQRVSRGRKTSVSNLDLYNRKYVPNTKEKKKKEEEFRWYKGFLPKVAPQIDDIARMHGGYFSKDVVKFIWNKYSTDYFETTFDHWGNSDEAIPMKFLGGQDIDFNNNFTLNLDLALSSYMKHYTLKAQLDEVYALGQGLKIYLYEKNNTDNPNPGAKRLVQWFEDSINLHILGRKQQTLAASGRDYGVVEDGRMKKFSWVKFLRSLKNFFAGPTMWLKPLTGLPNFVFASLVSIKEGIKGSLGISTSNAQFTISDLAEGFYHGFKLFFWNGLSNNSFRSNKAYVLMEKFGYLPDNHDWYTSNNELMTTRNQLFTSRTMMVFHSVPEEIIATAMFVAQMKAMKFTNTEGKEMSMWDAYDTDHKETLTNGDEVAHVRWVGGVRGKRSVSNVDDLPAYEDVTELLPEEINAIKFLYEKVHGGYRGDERTAAEYYIMGELLMQMKRYMPSILKNVWASQGIRYTQGNLKEITDDNGEKVLKWTPQVIEGRYRIFFGLVRNYLGIKLSTTDGEKGNGIARFLGLEPNTSYDWNKLEEAQKEDMKDFILTNAMWALLLIGYFKMWDRDDEDTLKRIYKRITDDFAGNVWILEMLKNAKNATQPVALNRGYQLLEGSASLSLSALYYAAGYTDQALTKEGNFRGASQVNRNLHFISAWHDWFSGVENSDLMQEYLK